MRYHDILVRMAKKTTIPDVGEDVEKVTHSFIADGNAK